VKQAWSDPRLKEMPQNPPSKSTTPLGRSSRAAGTFSAAALNPQTSGAAAPSTHRVAQPTLVAAAAAASPHPSARTSVGAGAISRSRRSSVTSLSSSDDKSDAAGSAGGAGGQKRVEFTPMNDELDKLMKEILDKNAELEFRDKIDKHIINENKVRLKTQISPLKWLAILCLAVAAIALIVLFPPGGALLVGGAIVIMGQLGLLIPLGTLGLTAFITVIHSMNVNKPAEDRYNKALKLIDKEKPEYIEKFKDTEFRSEVERIKANYQDISKPTSMLELKQGLHALKLKLGLDKEDDKPDEFQKAAHDIFGLQFDDNFRNKIEAKNRVLGRVKNAQEEYSKAINDRNAEAASDAAKKNSLVQKKN